MTLNVHVIRPLRIYILCEFTFFEFFSSKRQMIIQDKLVKELNDAKNAVEEYVYDLRDKLCGIYEKYITEDVSAAFFFFTYLC